MILCPMHANCFTKHQVSWSRAWCSSEVSDKQRCTEAHLSLLFVIFTFSIFLQIKWNWQTIMWIPVGIMCLQWFYKFGHVNYWIMHFFGQVNDIHEYWRRSCLLNKLTFTVHLRVTWNIAFGFCLVLVTNNNSFLGYPFWSCRFRFAVILHLSSIWCTLLIMNYEQGTISYHKLLVTAIINWDQVTKICYNHYIWVENWGIKFDNFLKMEIYVCEQNN